MCCNVLNQYLCLFLKLGMIVTSNLGRKQLLEFLCNNSDTCQEHAIALVCGMLNDCAQCANLP